MKRWQELEAMGTQAGSATIGLASRAGLGFISGFVLLIMGDGSREHRRRSWIPLRADRRRRTLRLAWPCSTAVGALQTVWPRAAPTVSDLERFKAELEDIQKGDLARLCASGSRLWLAMAEGMARLFSPLSGAGKLNRAWAAMVDKHWPEAAGSVSRRSRS